MLRMARALAKQALLDRACLDIQSESGVEQVVNSRPG